MKRAILVSSSTAVGLVAVLTYSGADQVPALAAGPSDTSGGAAAGLGAPPAEEPAAEDPSASESPSAAASASASTTPSAAATPSAASPAAAPTKAAATKAAAKATPAPTATKAAAPKPSPTPTPKPTVAVAKDFLGPVVTHKYGKVQVGIRVKAGKIISAWAAVYPTGDSQPYTDFAIPVLKAETVKAQKSSVAAVSGATLTSKAWNTSLSSAFSKAGL